MMREVILGDRQFKYLNATATRLLSDARATALRAGLTQHALVALSPTKCPRDKLDLSPFLLRSDIVLAITHHSESS